MWLLHSETRKLHYFNNAADVPGGYAILSHTWDNQEVSFNDIQDLHQAKTKEGYYKIYKTCQQAKRDGFTYAWVDTCCIDKKSSAELSEAINSMFRWYAEAKVCYVYLSDVEKRGSSIPMDAYNQLRKSRWFTRGWTLQELIAPAKANFYDREWRFLGEKGPMLQDLHEITRIDPSVLNHHSGLKLTSVAQRMSWAARRNTTRIEDQAYSLLGIFGVNMPMLYGEGDKAFQRLQEEIIRASPTVDHSILAWKYPTTGGGSYLPVQSHGLLAPSPECFRHAHDIISWGLPQSQTFEMLQRGLRIAAPITQTYTRSVDEVVHTVALNCRYQKVPSSRIILSLVQRPHIEELNAHGRYQSSEEEDISYDRTYNSDGGRSGQEGMIDASAVHGAAWSKRTITIARQPFSYPIHGDRVQVVLKYCSAVTLSAVPGIAQMLPLQRIGGIDSHLSGFLKILLHERELKSDSIKVYMEVRSVFQNENGHTVVAANRPPFLVVRTWEPGPHIRSSDPLSSGEERMFPAKAGNLSISARYVHLIDEFLWSIKIMPFGYKSGVSDEKQVKTPSGDLGDKASSGEDSENGEDRDNAEKSQQ